YLNWYFTLIALSVTPILALEVYRQTHRIKQATRAVRKKESEVVSVVQEALSSIRVVKAFAREDYEEKRLEKKTRESIVMALRALSRPGFRPWLTSSSRQEPASCCGTGPGWRSVASSLRAH